MGLDAVGIAPAVPLLDDVAGVGQVGDDAERPALGDAERRGDVAQARPGVVGDAYEGSRMVGEEAPLRDKTSVGVVF